MIFIIVLNTTHCGLLSVVTDNYSESLAVFLSGFIGGGGQNEPK